MKKFLPAVLCIIVIFSFGTHSFAFDSGAVDTMVSDTAEYMYETVKDPQIGSIGGEWAVLGLARSGIDIPEAFYKDYYANAENYVKKCGGVLHDKKYTEYSRLVVALTAIGKNPADVAGFNLLTPLGDYAKTVWQGLNGAAWALIALDSNNYDVPQNKDAEIRATRELYVNFILQNQTQDGGWAMSGDIADPDVTAMALQALSKYQDREDVKKATEKALSAVSAMQNGNGGFASWGTENSESCAQMIIALCELGIPLEDARFVKNGKTMLDYLCSYYIPHKGFKHIQSEAESNQMATEQGFCALVSLKRMSEGRESLYRMTGDKKSFAEDNKKYIDPDVRKASLISYGKTFQDIAEHNNRTAIEWLAQRNIISGKTENLFDPDSTMTRAEFATITVKSLGLPFKGDSAFSDVTESDWFFGFVNTACHYGIAKGVSQTEFNPNGTITREEAAVMAARAAKLCGLKTEYDAFESRNIMAGFSDYIKISDWAMSAMAFCFDSGILSDSVLEVKPKEFVLRAEIAQMLYNMLIISGLY
ncbi:MAG: S-layer homology domain-containing protein [Clostridia bacterium]|nr:S-layer homology domain-containing protein [Clostridia bacterium]